MSEELGTATSIHRLAPTTMVRLLVDRSKSTKLKQSSAHGQREHGRKRSAPKKKGSLKRKPEPVDEKVEHWLYRKERDNQLLADATTSAELSSDEPQSVPLNLESREDQVDGPAIEIDAPRQDSDVLQIGGNDHTHSLLGNLVTSEQSEKATDGFPAPARIGRPPKSNISHDGNYHDASPDMQESDKFLSRKQEHPVSPVSANSTFTNAAKTLYSLRTGNKSEEPISDVDTNGDSHSIGEIQSLQGGDTTERNSPERRKSIVRMPKNVHRFRATCRQRSNKSNRSSASNFSNTSTNLQNGPISLSHGSANISTESTNPSKCSSNHSNHSKGSTSQSNASNNHSSVRSYQETPLARRWQENVSQLSRPHRTYEAVTSVSQQPRSALSKKSSLGKQLRRMRFRKQSELRARKGGLSDKNQQSNEFFEQPSSDSDADLMPRMAAIAETDSADIKQKKNKARAKNRGLRSSRLLSPRRRALLRNHNIGHAPARTNSTALPEVSLDNSRADAVETVLGPPHLLSPRSPARTLAVFKFSQEIPTTLASSSVSSGMAAFTASEEVTSSDEKVLPDLPSQLEVLKGSSLKAKSPDELLVDGTTETIPRKSQDASADDMAIPSFREERKSKPTAVSRKAHSTWSLWAFLCTDPTVFTSVGGAEQNELQNECAEVRMDTQFEHDLRDDETQTRTGDENRDEPPVTMCGNEQQVDAFRNKVVSNITGVSYSEQERRKSALSRVHKLLTSETKSFDRRSFSRFLTSITKSSGESLASEEMRTLNGQRPQRSFSFSVDDRGTWSSEVSEKGPTSIIPKGLDWVEEALANGLIITDSSDMNDLSFYSTASSGSQSSCFGPKSMQIPERVNSAPSDLSDGTFTTYNGSMSIPEKLPSIVSRGLSPANSGSGKEIKSDGEASELTEKILSIANQLSMEANELLDKLEAGH